MFRFETLDIWKDSIGYCSDVYKVVDQLPKVVQYSLGSQMRSAALSISNNIAEGCGSSSAAEFRNFLNYSIRSLYEVVSMLVIMKKRNYLNDSQYEDFYGRAEKLVKQIRAFRKVI